MGIQYKQWIIDTKKMTCRNMDNSLEVSFTLSSGNTLEGTITDFSSDFLFLHSSLNMSADDFYNHLTNIVRYIFAKHYFQGKQNPYSKLPFDVDETICNFIWKADNNMRNIA
jgi:hypothetical protein